MEQELVVLQSAGFDLPTMVTATGRSESHILLFWNRLADEAHELGSPEIMELVHHPGAIGRDFSGLVVRSLSGMPDGGDSLAAWLLAGVRTPPVSIDRSADLQELQAGLGLTSRDSASLFEVDPELVDSWLAHTPMPLVQSIRLDRALAGLAKLRAMFRDAALPSVIRRPAPVFGGRCALDLILAGNLTTVLGSYDRLLSYSA